MSFPSQFRAPRRLVAAGIIVIAAGAVSTLTTVPTRAQAVDQVGTATYAETGSPQSFTVPGSVTEVTVDLAGANGGGTSQFNDASYLEGGYGGSATGSISVNPSDVLEVTVGAAGSSDGSTGGYNGGGQGDTNGGGSGGGGATDIRTGACATSLDCPLSSRTMVAGGGGGAGNPIELENGFGSPGYGGDAGGATGSDGGSGDSLNSAGGGATQDAGGSAGGSGASAGSAGALASGGTGGAAGGGGGGGGYYGGGGGGGGSSDGGGGGGGSSVGPSGANLITAGGSDFVDQSGNGTAGIYWETSSTTTYVAGEQFTLTAHLPSDVSGTETFTDGDTTLCSDVAVSNGQATCATSVGTAGPATFTATFTGTQQTPEVATAHRAKPALLFGSSARFNGTVQAITVTVTASGVSGVSATPTPAPTSTPTPTPAPTATPAPAGAVKAISTPSTGAATQPGQLPFGVVLMCAGAMLILSSRRRRTER